MRITIALPKFFLVVILSMFYLSQVKAAHIAGYDMSVQWLSGNSYKVNLKIFRDCANFGANFDNNASFTLYENSTNIQVSTFDMVLDSIVSVTLGDTCFPAPQGMCMEEGFYSAVVDFPNNVNGYYMAWERCCRSPIISNLQLPNTFGTVFYAQVPSNNYTNSTPVFGRYPSNGYLCVNQINYIDFNVTENDGDSLVYSLIEPMAGTFSSNTNPSPNGSNPMPYATANWAGGFGLTNIVGGTPAMSINAQTGIITCSPVATGIYTFCVKVEEYRNGVKLGEIVRDINYYAINCASQHPNFSQSDSTYSFQNDTSVCIAFEFSSSLVDSMFVQVNSNDVILDSALISPIYSNSGFYYSELGELDSVNMPLWQLVDSATILGLDEIQIRYCWDVPCTIVDSTYDFDIEVVSKGCTSDTLSFSTSLNITRITKSLNLNDTILCFNDSLVIELDSLYSADWSIGTSNLVEVFNSPGVYSVYMEDTVNGCVAADTFSLNFYPELTIEVPNDTILCPEDSMLLWFVSSGGNGSLLNSNWEDNNGLSNGGSSHFVNPNTKTTYILTVEDECMTVYDSVQIDVEQFPKFQILADTLQGCLPLTIQFELNQLDSIEIDSVHWDFQNGFFSMNSLSVETDYTVPGTYNTLLDLVSALGCVYDTTITNMIEVFDSPEASFLSTPNVVTLSNTMVNFVNQSTGADTYLWKIDSLVTSSNEHLEFLFPNQNPDTYKVCLWVENEQTCIDSICHDITINGEMSLFIPNSFTPNNDGVNDVFIPFAKYHDEVRFSFIILDRWGQLVFSSDSGNASWDGTMKGSSPAPIGTYIYKVNIKDRWSLNERQVTGHVNLIR